MRMLVNVLIPAEPFNSLVRKGTAGETIQKILASIKPETVYFTEQDGNRGALLVVDLKDPSAIPGIAEPFFLAFNAQCKFRIAMTPEELAKSDLDKIAKKA
ncbi:MAG: panthothenate synthetase [Planctomycetota bacterium]|nr:panthothenate synthetase [Planctomycetota bacterium]